MNRDYLFVFCRMNKCFSCVALLAVCLATVGCHAQTALHTLDFSVSAKNFVDTIPIEWENNQVYVPVEMGGRQYRFLLDTGSGHVVYADTPIEGMRQVGVIRSLDANNRADTVPMVVLPPLTVGHLTFTDCQATVHRRSVSGRRVDGVLGFDIMAKTIGAKIDVAARQLILTDRKNFFDREGGFVTKYRLSHFVPYIDVSPFVGYTEQALFDTGSPNLYRINRQRYDEALEEVGDLAFDQMEGRSVGRYAIGLHGVEPRGDVVFLALDRLCLGDYALNHLHTLTTQGGSHVGAPLLSYGAVVLNPRKHQLRFLPYNESRACEVNNRQLDIAFVSEGGRPVVGLVWERSDAYEQGLREGDIVVKIDGRTVPDFATFSYWHYEPGREYTFTLQDRRGFQREVKWGRLPKEKK